MKPKVEIEFVLYFENEQYRVGEPIEIYTRMIMRSGVITKITPKEITIENSNDRIITFEIDNIVSICNPLNKDEDI